MRITHNMTPQQRREAFLRMFGYIPDHPRGQRVADVARWMGASVSTVHIWSAPSAVKIPSASRIMLLQAEMEKAGIVIPDDLPN